MATVRTKDGRERHVKNLGWLLAHWRDVASLEISPDPGGGAHLTAHLHNGGTYDTGWASYTVFCEWIKRPVFRGVPLVVTWPDGSSYGDRS